MKRFTLLFTLAFALFFAGCDGAIGDENDNIDNIDNADENNNGDVQKGGVIMSMSYEYSRYEGDNYSVNLSYDDKGRLVKFVTSYTDEEGITITYSEDGKKAYFVTKGDIDIAGPVDERKRYANSSYETYDINCVANFNDDGNVIDIYGEEELWNEWIYTGGYITESRAYGTYSYYTNDSDGTGEYIEGSVVTKGTLTWKDGNMTAMQSAEHYDTGSVNYPMSESFEYGSLLNDYSLDLNAMLLGEIFETAGVGLSMAAIFNCGATSKNLVKSGQSFREDGEGKSELYSTAMFTYTTDNDGYVTKAVIARDYADRDSTVTTDDTVTVNITYY